MAADTGQIRARCSRFLPHRSVCVHQMPEHARLPGSTRPANSKRASPAIQAPLPNRCRPCHTIPRRVSRSRDTTVSHANRVQTNAAEAAFGASRAEAVAATGPSGSAVPTF